jgi:pimeloyl-ACP methyl ester carboxylesterase
VLLAFALALTLPRSLPAVIALAVSIVYELSPLASAPLRLRLARNAQAPLGGYYFFAFPVAVAVGEALRWSLSIAIPILLLGLALPQLAGALRVWRRRYLPGMDRQIDSKHKLVVSTRDPHQYGPPW